MTSNEHEILINILKSKPHVIHYFESEDEYEFIINCYERLRKLGIVHQHGVEFGIFTLEVR